MNEEDEYLDDELDESQEPEELEDLHDSYEEKQPEPDENFLDAEYVEEPNYDAYDEEIEKRKLLTEHQFLSNRNRQLEEEVNNLWKSNIKSYEALSEAYEKDLQQKINESKAKQRKALEDYDVDAQLAAQTELAEAIANLTAFKNDKKEEPEEVIYPIQQESIPEVDDSDYLEEYANHLNQTRQENVRRWQEANDWFNPDSRRYDRELAEYLQNYSLSLENRLYREGKSHLIHSPDYFRHIDAARDSAAEERRKSREALRMQGSSNGVSSGKGEHGARSYSKNRDIGLDDDELRIARLCKIEPDAYKKFRDNMQGGGRR